MRTYDRFAPPGSSDDLRWRAAMLRQKVAADLKMIQQANDQDTRRPMEMLSWVLLAGWLAAVAIVGWALHGLAGAL